MRSIIITGVSRGLGAALLGEFAEAGDRILALGRHFTPEQEGLSAGSDRFTLRTTDLAKPDTLPDATELRAFLDGAPASFDGAREIVLIHNAALFEPFGAIGRLPAADLATAVAVNLTAPMLLTNTLLGCVSPGELTTVVYISSSAAHRLGGGRAVYGATKRAGEWFCETLRVEHEDDPGVTVTMVDPGIMDTDMQRDIRRHAREDSYFPGRERFLVRHERGELPSPSQVARSIVAGLPRPAR